LNKPMMKLPHGGGLKLTRNDPAYAVLRQWIAEGCRPDAEDAPRCVKIELYPHSSPHAPREDTGISRSEMPTMGRLLKWPAHTQQLAVLAHFADGAVRDVTQLA